MIKKNEVNIKYKIDSKQQNKKESVIMSSCHQKIRIMLQNYDFSKF